MNLYVIWNNDHDSDGKRNPYALKIGDRGEKRIFVSRISERKMMQEITNGMAKLRF